VWVYVCVWATLPDLNKMEWNGMEWKTPNCTQVGRATMSRAYAVKLTYSDNVMYSCLAMNLNVTQTFHI